MDPGYYGFGVVFTDLNDDGWPDIYVANDSVPNLLFRNRKDGTFVEEGLIAGAALSGDGRPQAGMGVDAGDYNGDGRLDLIVTNFSHDYNTLYENGPVGVFSDAATRRESPRPRVRISAGASGSWTSTTTAGSTSSSPTATSTPRSIDTGWARAITSGSSCS